MEEPEANVSLTQDQNSLVEKAVNSFVDLVSSQAKGLVARAPQAATTSRGDVRPPVRLQIPAQQQASSIPAPNSVQRDMQRSFPAFYQGRKSRGKRPFPSPSVIIPACRRCQLTFCLLPESTSKTPKTETNLLQAGLGRRSICIIENADHEEITRVLTEEYPKMRELTGGWLLYKATGGTGQRNLSVVAQGAEGYTVKTLKLSSNNGKQLLYIVPLQEKLDTAPLPHAAQFSKMRKSCCKTCGIAMPLPLLVIHIETCRHLQEGDMEMQQEQDVNIEDQVQSTCPVCDGQYPAVFLPYHASSCGESTPENLPSSSSSPDIRAIPQRSQEMHGSISTPDLDAERRDLDTHGDPFVFYFIIVWKTILCPQAAVTLFKRDFATKGDGTPNPGKLGHPRGPSIPK
ncbi:uncharacterized protein LOC134026396 isoform X3 [Osmerus eperlanus]|uniref:uncharacterized protein LOC134026396 isoform X3 n=1 Tax=Osmerus eperlanus TaxID=29151 RepID=UPI002E12EA3C